MMLQLTALLHLFSLFVFSDCLNEYELTILFGHFIELFSVFQEFMTICKNLTDEQVRAAFAKFDTSGDDQLDYREFCQMINNKQDQE